MTTKYMKVARGKLFSISQYPNFHKSGSISGMKNLFYGKHALLVRCGSWIYNVPEAIYDAA